MRNIKGYLINNCDYCKVCNFCQGWPLSLSFPGITKPSCHWSQKGQVIRNGQETGNKTDTDTTRTSKGLDNMYQTPRLALNVLPLCRAAGLISGLEDSLLRCSCRSVGSSCSLSVSTEVERDADTWTAEWPPTHLSFQDCSLMIWNSRCCVTYSSLHWGAPDMHQTSNYCHVM